MRRKTIEEDENRVDGGQGTGQSITSPHSERAGEQPEHGSTDTPASPTTSPVGPAGGAAEETAEQPASTTQPLQGLGVSEATENQPSTTTNAQTSPKSGSKLSSWFRGRISRRFSKPPPEKKSEESGEQDLTGHSREETTDNPRAAPLTSNPVTETDLVPATASPQPEEEDNVANEGIVRQWSSSTEQSNQNHRRWSSSPSEQDGNRKRRLRMSLRDMITRKSSSEQGSATTSPLASPAMTTSSASKALGTTTAAAPTSAPESASSRPAPAPRMNTMERNELRDSFVEQSLPPPPSVFQDSSRRSVSSSARDSKFSEDI